MDFPALDLAAFENATPERRQQMASALDETCRNLGFLTLTGHGIPPSVIRDIEREVALFFAHIFENIGMCVQLMPITGIPLPLISYSGTFVVICMFLLGLVQSVWVHRKPPRTLVEE